MAAKIKLQRKGTKSKPVYRLIVQDESASTSSGAIEVLGIYDPRAKEPVFNIDKEKVLAWITKGAKPTDKVRVLLGKAGVLSLVSYEGKPKRKPRKEMKAEAKAAEAKAAEVKPVETKPAEKAPEVKEEAK